MSRQIPDVPQTICTFRAYHVWYQGDVWDEQPGTIYGFLTVRAGWFYVLVMMLPIRS